MEQRNVSYGELLELQRMFDDQVNAAGVTFSDNETKEQALFDFVDQYINGNDSPQIRR